MFSSKALSWFKFKLFFPQSHIEQWVLENFRSIDEFLGMPLNSLLNKGWPHILAEPFAKLKNYKPAEHLKSLEQLNIKFVCIEDEAYPPLLKVIKEPPPLLFYKGEFSYLLEKTVSIVGSRRCTIEGVNFTKKIASHLAANGYVIVSGLAAGIDTAAHQGALNSGKTVAVLGCGLDICFPQSNNQLFKKIEDKGCLISEYLVGQQPLKQNFPYRNRIISGLSEKLIVVEAGDKSGALITANRALEQGREVLASPGNPNHRLSKGCNRLIKDGAFLIDEIEDIDYFFELEKQVKKKQQNIKEPLLELLSDKPLSLEELAEQSGQNTPSLLAKLTELEIAQLIAKNNDNRYFLT